MKKEKTSVYLLSKKYEDAKKEAKESGVSYSDWVADAIDKKIADPNYTNPTKSTTDWDKILQKLKDAQAKSIQEQDNKITEVVKHLEAKIDSIMDKFQIEKPVNDKSGRRIFD